MDDLTGSITARIRLTGSRTGVSTYGDAEIPLNITQAIDFAFGTGANQANTFYVAQRTLVASTSESLDFASGGGLVNPFGEAIALSEVKGIYVYNSHATLALALGGANNIPIFAATSDIISIRPTGILLLVGPDAAGYAVTGGTGDLLTFNNAGGSSIVYDILVWGN